jgi:hypothetical protein
MTFGRGGGNKLDGHQSQITAGKRKSVESLVVVQVVLVESWTKT